MPKVQHRDRETALLATYSAAHQTHDELCVLMPPSLELLVKAIDVEDVASPNSEVAGFGALPATSVALSQRAIR
jgi:hypothetical protein